MAHKHATEMLQYAQDAADTDTPWKRWELCEVGNDIWTPLNYHPEWAEETRYRRIAERVTFEGKVEWLAPMSEAPEEGKRYWAIDTSVSQPVQEYTWAGDHLDRMYLARGIAFATEDAARECWDAMQTFLSGGEA